MRLTKKYAFVDTFSGVFNFVVSIPGQILIKIQKKIKVKKIVNCLIFKIGMVFTTPLRLGKKREKNRNGLLIHICSPKSRFMKKKPYTDLS